jgi:hypothetical protein
MFSQIPVPGLDEFRPEPPTILLGDPTSPKFQHEMHNHALPHLLAARKRLPWLRTSFDDKFLLGSLSICLASDPSSRYPLWVEALIGELEITSRKLDMWETASTWINEVLSQSHTDERASYLGQDCLQLWDTIPWTGEVSLLGSAVSLTAEHLALFLSDQWLNDDLMNAGADYILRQLSCQCTSRITNSLFLGTICSRKISARGGPYIPAKRGPNSELESFISTGRVTVLYWMVHNGKDHWTLLKIDLTNWTYSYYDSLSPHAHPPHETLDLILWWLASLLPKETQPFPSHPAPWPLALPRQYDGFSCGVIVLNILGNILIGDQLWTPREGAAHRMEWFLRLSQGFLPMLEVCIVLLSFVKLLI